VSDARASAFTGTVLSATQEVEDAEKHVEIQDEEQGRMTECFIEDCQLEIEPEGGSEKEEEDCTG